ncbi:MAG: AAA family ATPase [Candidatus Limnocylindria bacterium]
MVRVTACTNQKGGVGKTTTVVNLAASLALSGTSTLVIDLDPQGNATSGLGVDRRSLDRSVYDALIDRVPIGELTLRTAVEGLDLVPSAVALSGAEVELVGMPGRERRLSVCLAGLGHKYDRVFIDCPPSLGLLTVNALTAADGVLIPIQTEYYALEGLSQLVNTIRLIRESLNPRLEIDGVLLTMFDGRTRLSVQVAAEVRRHLNGTVYDTVVPRSVRLAEAPSHGLPIAVYDPSSRGARAYGALALEVAARG